MCDYFQTKININQICVNGGSEVVQMFILHINVILDSFTCT